MGPFRRSQPLASKSGGLMTFAESFNQSILTQTPSHHDSRGFASDRQNEKMLEIERVVWL
jgi:hypothetical protein